MRKKEKGVKQEKAQHAVACCGLTGWRRVSLTRLMANSTASVWDPVNENIYSSASQGAGTLDCILVIKCGNISYTGP